MIISPSIQKNPPEASSQNYAYLRELCMAYLEKIGSKKWTDFNIHDPGITIMEVFCYAITDLGLRTSFDIADLLATKEDNLLNMHQQFNSAIKILPTCPVSISDYRTLFISNIASVKNAWLTPVEIPYTLDCTASELIPESEVSNPDRANHAFSTINVRGLYHIDIELDGSEYSEEEQDDIIEEVRSMFHRFRNMGEDLSSISLIDTSDVLTCMEIELENAADIPSIHAQILIAIEDYLSPPIQFYSLAEMLDKGYTAEDIFQGPLILDDTVEDEIPRIVANDKGFLDPIEIQQSQLRTEVRVSDIIREIMKIPGIIAIRKFSLNHCQEQNNDSQSNEWVLKVPTGKKPALCHDKSKIIFYKDLLPFKSNLTDVENIYQALRAASINEQQRQKEDLPMPLGDYLNLSSYTSIQHDFPPLYGIGNNGLSGDASKERKAQAKQLQAYLSFFDQLLANYLAQLSKIKTLFSLDPENSRTYFTQVIKGVNDLKDIFKDYEGLPNQLDELIEPTSSSWVRKNTILDHLLSRFAEKFTDYVLLIQDIYGNAQTPEMVAKNKINFLQDYPKISCERGKGFDYYNEDSDLWDSANVSGFQHRLGRLLGQHSTNRRSLSTLYYQLYQEQDDDMVSERRFRIRNKGTNKILLSSTTRFFSRADVLNELETALKMGMHKENYHKITTTDGRFSFFVADKGGDQLSRRIEYFTTEAARDLAMEEVVQYLNDMYSDEGMYLIEHILLRPKHASDPFMTVCVDSTCGDCQNDPYSFQVHIILPAYSFRFMNMNFRRYVEKLIRLELPAHIFPKICWIDIEQMIELEPLYKSWLEAHRISVKDGVPNPHIAPLLEKLGQLYSIYPEGSLHDCEDEGAEENGNSIILGQSQLGSIDN